jgi:hypothetical protein
MADVTPDWRDVTASRLARFRAARRRNVAVHGSHIVDGRDDFCRMVANLFQAGALAGLKIIAR